MANGPVETSQPNLDGMARSHLTLAALATAAVPGVDVVAARTYSLGEQGDFDSALLTTRDGRELVIRVPTSQSAETEQSADLIALRALTTGVRSRLPFDVPGYLGQAPISGTRAVVYDFLPGDKVSVQSIGAADGLAASIGTSIAAIHGLTTAFVAEAGLPSRSAAECRQSTVTLVGRAADTGRVPASLVRRWEQATDDDGLWQFTPTVVNGALSADSFLVRGATVAGIIGWGSLQVGDPAKDLHWLLAAHPESTESAMGSYLAGRGLGSDAQVSQRAMLYAELELARWLLHGLDTHNEGIVDDAVQMLDGLVDTVHSDVMNPLSPPTGPVLTVDAVEALLDSTPRGRTAPDASHLHTDSYDRSEFENGLAAFESEFDSERPDDAASDGSSSTNTDPHADRRSSSE
ncbi:aminoglycoside phosphotransferase (APT) family kinase protein [Compostimonas suwonensis]|uniref:Aminoglycoside phosphotransferase (APT) family kinase protein n=1 Tax=Compostimonas suwonensis TaxID=1048394 RepID=A0A2M9BWE8_9MICO|nr:aminoglycoside phosphotransferase (APT) family kinase protein [Compostimonas suwonensis]